MDHGKILDLRGLENYSLEDLFAGGNLSNALCAAFGAKATDIREPQRAVHHIYLRQDALVAHLSMGDEGHQRAQVGQAGVLTHLLYTLDVLGSLARWQRMTRARAFREL